MSTLKPYNYSAPIQGVQVKPMSEDGAVVKVRYNGLLYNSGAEQVFMHTGFGRIDEWKDVDSIPMERTQEGWEKTVRIKESQMNFCFKDTVDNWDNNNGMNWIYRIS